MTFLNNKNIRILGFEALLFSALYGVAFRSWVVFGVMFLGSFWLLNRPRGTVHMIYAMSLLWGFIAFSVGHSISWGWAAMLGGSFDERQLELPIPCKGLKIYKSLPVGHAT